MGSQKATATSSPNIAFIKYWGNTDNDLRIPVNGSISMNLASLKTTTTVEFQDDLTQDHLILNTMEMAGAPLERVSGVLERVRFLAGINARARVTSENNFPTGAGIASSAAAFAALALAASKAAGLELSEKDLSRLARFGSGSASRSVPSGFVEWLPGTGDEDSYAVSIAPPAHWKLVDCITVIESAHKQTGSTEGHALASTSPLQVARVADAPRRLNLCRKAILERDFNVLTSVIEQDSHIMHAVMMTSNPPLFYWEPASIQIMKSVAEWRRNGLPVCSTLDAGPNVHVLCPEEYASQVTERLASISSVKSILASPVGQGVLLETVE
ncbi:MAG: diphosphomevalonate decarboxylase [Anaerolineaceae bacterium]